jgi:hypothetical protein
MLEVRAALEQKEGHVLLADQTIEALNQQIKRSREEIDNLKKLHPEMALLSSQVCPEPSLLFDLLPDVPSEHLPPLGRASWRTPKRSRTRP